MEKCARLVIPGHTFILCLTKCFNIFPFEALPPVSGALFQYTRTFINIRNHLILGKWFLMRKRIGLDPQEIALIIKSVDFLVQGGRLLYTGEEFQIALSLLHRLRGGRIRKPKDSEKVEL